MKNCIFLIETIKKQIDIESEDILLANDDKSKIKEYQSYISLLTLYKKSKEKLGSNSIKGI